MTPQLEKLCEIASDAHARIQKNHAKINPIVGVSHKMRENAVPADTMTIDCLGTKKRIIIVLHDQQPDVLHYQYSFTDQDPARDFKTQTLSELSVETLYTWIEEYFAV